MGEPQARGASSAHTPVHAHAALGIVSSGLRTRAANTIMLERSEEKEGVLMKAATKEEEHNSFDA